MGSSKTPRRDPKQLIFVDDYCDMPIEVYEAIKKSRSPVGRIVPEYHSPYMRRILFDRYGLPNSAPTDEEIETFGFAFASITTRRVAFVDDDDNGRLVAYWSPERK